MKYRIEFDSIGKIKVPGDKNWGASTERSNRASMTKKRRISKATSWIKRAIAFPRNTDDECTGVSNMRSLAASSSSILTARWIAKRAMSRTATQNKPGPVSRSV